jgi:RNA polymerase sigma-70 factor (ECF subfamily)
VTELLPSEPETLGLLALLLHAEARRGARRDTAGNYVPLSEQDQSRWNWEQIAEAESLIRRAASFHTIGRYQLEAALQSAHVHRRRTGEANWGEIIGIYDALVAIAPSPVVRLNRAIAIGHLDGPAAALAILDDLADEGRLAQYQAYWAVRADLLSKCDAGDDARRAYDTAIGLERDPAVRSYLLDRRSRID